MSGVPPGFEPGIPGRRQDFGIPHQSLPRRFSEEPTPMEDRPASSGRICMVTSLTVLHYQWVILLQSYSTLVFILKEMAIDSDVRQLLLSYPIPEIQRLEHRLKTNN
jgi:hypothetical protein